jgi:hypothetical protein
MSKTARTLAIADYEGRCGGVPRRPAMGLRRSRAAATSPARLAASDTEWQHVTIWSHTTPDDRGND